MTVSISELYSPSTGAESKAPSSKQKLNEISENDRPHFGHVFIIGIITSYSYKLLLKLTNSERNFLQGGNRNEIAGNSSRFDFGDYSVCRRARCRCGTSFPGILQ